MAPRGGVRRVECEECVDCGRKDCPKLEVAAPENVEVLAPAEASEPPWGLALGLLVILLLPVLVVTLGAR